MVGHVAPRLDLDGALGALDEGSEIEGGGDAAASDVDAQGLTHGVGDGEGGFLLEGVLAVLDGVEQRADVGEIGVGAGGGELAGIDRQGERYEAVGVGRQGGARNACDRGVGGGRGDEDGLGAGGADDVVGEGRAELGWRRVGDEGDGVGAGGGTGVADGQGELIGDPGDVERIIGGAAGDLGALGDRARAGGAGGDGAAEPRGGERGEEEAERGELLGLHCCHP